jgi:uracil-DNA glycosylase family 4
MNENEECSLCDLATTCSSKSICLKGGGSWDAALVVYLDAPTIVEDKRGQGLVSDAASFLKWLLRRMSVDTSQVYVDYVLKCYTKSNKNFGKKAYRQQYIEACSVYRFATLQQIKPKALVAMGATACEAFVGSEKVANYEGTSWTPIEPRVREVIDRVWVTYSPAYALQDPAESVGIYRTIFAAAQEAGLKPKLNDKIILYDYGF